MEHPNIGCNYVLKIPLDRQTLINQLGAFQSYLGKALAGEMPARLVGLESCMVPKVKVLLLIRSRFEYSCGKCGIKIGGMGSLYSGGLHYECHERL